MDQNQLTEKIKLILKFKWRKWAAQMDTTFVYFRMSDNPSSICLTFIEEEIGKTIGTLCIWVHLNKNTNPIAVRLSLRHIENATWNYLYQNPSPLLFDLQTNPVLGRETYAMPNLFKNPNRDIVDFLFATLEESTLQQYGIHFSNNPNPKAVSYLLRNPHLISRRILHFNSSPEAIDYLLSEPEQVDWNLFNLNTGDRAVEYLMAHPERIVWHSLAINCNDKAVSILMDHLRPLTYEWAFRLCQNTNPRIANFILPFMDELVQRNEMDISRGIPNWFNLAANPGLFVEVYPTYVLHIWTHYPQNVLYRLPLELVRMICDFL